MDSEHDGFCLLVGLNGWFVGCLELGSWSGRRTRSFDGVPGGDGGGGIVEVGIGIGVGIGLMGGESLESRLREIELIRGRCHASDGRLDSSARWNRDHGGSRCRSGALGDLRCQDVKMSRWL